MAIDLFCYSTSNSSELEKFIKRMVGDNENLFLQKFFVSMPRDASLVHKEIASEFGLEAQSLFLIRVNDKNAVAEISDVVDLVKLCLGKDKVIILWENERLI